VDVVGHNDEFVVKQVHVWTDLGGSEPFFPYDLTEFVQPHFPVHDLAERVGAPVGADGDEVGTGLGVVVFRQSDGSAVMSVCRRH